MPEAAIFVADPKIFTGPVETRGYLGDLTRNHHDVRIRTGEDETMNDIGTGERECHRRPDGNLNLIGLELPSPGDDHGFVLATTQITQARLIEGWGRGECTRIDPPGRRRNVYSRDQCADPDPDDTQHEHQTSQDHEDSFVRLDPHIHPRPSMSK